MPKTLAELQETVVSLGERKTEAKLSQFSIDDDANFLYIEEGPENRAEKFGLDEIVERALGRYLGVPKAYLEKLDDEFKAVTLNHWFRKKSNASAVVEVVSDHFVTVHSPNQVIIPLRDLVEALSEVLDPTWRIVHHEHSDTVFQLDIISDDQIVEIPAREDIEDRNPLHHATLHDIVRGGIRFRTNPNEATEPIIQALLYRDWNTTSAVGGDLKISLKAKTVEDILTEIKAALKLTREDLPHRLGHYLNLCAQYPPVGNRETFCRKLGEEHKIPARVLKKILDRIGQLPDDATLFDVVQVFAAYANEEGVKYETALKLQALAGEVAFDTDVVTHRCGACQTLLED